MSQSKQNLLDDLKSSDAKQRVYTLRALLVRPSSQPEILAELENLLDDRTCELIKIPIQFGEVRILAAEALAVARAQLGDPRPVRLCDVPKPLTVDKMQPFWERAGLPTFGGPRPLEGYIKLRDAGLLPTSDYEFDPDAQ